MDDCFGDTDTKTKCICMTISLVVVLTTVLVGLSFSAVEPIQYGILYNTISKTIDLDTVHEGGLQYIGLFNTFVKYPKSHKTIEFSNNKEADATPLQTRTKEGLELQLHFAFQYQLVKKSLPKLYRLVGQEYNDLFIKIASDVVLQQAGEYTAPQYWKNRSYIGEQMEIKLNEKLQKAHANCTGFMMLMIVLPESYEQSIVETQVVNQQRTTQLLIKNSTLIKQGIEVDRSNATRFVDIINAEAESKALITKNEADAKILGNTISYQGRAYVEAKQSVSIGTNSELLDYVFFLNVMSLDKTSQNSKLLVGLNSATVNIKGI